MCHGKRRDDDNQRSRSPERDHDTEQEQQVIDAFENVPKAGYDEAQRGLVPARIETQKPRIAMEFKRARLTTRRHETQRRRNIASEPPDAGMDRKFAPIR